MDWILIGIVAQSLITATFTSKDACQGRVATLHDSKIEAKCVESPHSSYGVTSSIGICTVDSTGAVRC